MARPSHTIDSIERKIKRRQFEEAAKMCDESAEYYKRKLQSLQDLLMRAKRGIDGNSAS